MTSVESLLKAYLAAGDAGELDHLGRYLHDDVILHDPNGRGRGLDHEKETWRASRAAMQDLGHDVREVLSSGSMVAARIKVSGILHGTFAGVSADGRAFEVDQAIFMLVSGGKAQEIWTIVDTGSFYRQVGMFPES